MAAKLDAVSENIEALKKRLQEEKVKKRKLETQIQNERTQLVGSLILEEINKEGGVIDKASLYTLLETKLAPKQLELFPELAALGDPGDETETTLTTELEREPDEPGVTNSLEDLEPTPVRR